MSLLELDAFHLAAIYVSDMDAAQKFYSGILGFEKKTNMGSGVIMRHEAAKLTIYLEGNRQPRDSAEMEFPMTSICLNATNGVKDAMATLTKADIPIVGTFGDMTSDFAGFHFKDPSGNVLEIAGRP
jgi:catechol-2,3-dioxygenase